MNFSLQTAITLYYSRYLKTKQQLQQQKQLQQQQKSVLGWVWCCGVAISMLLRNYNIEILSKKWVIELFF